MKTEDRSQKTEDARNTIAGGCRALVSSVFCLLASVFLLVAPLPAQKGPSKEARDAFTLALESHRAKKLDTAIDHFLKAYAADASILTFNDEGLLDAALTSLQGRLAANPKDLDLNYKLAELSNIKGYSDESAKYYRQVLALAPQSPQAAVAREEIRKLEAAAKAAAAAAPPPPPPAPADESAATTAAPTGDSMLTGRIQQLQEELDKAKTENGELQEKLDKLQKEHDDLKKKADKWYFYYTRFFADPRNVQNLQGGQ